ncbi:MAG: alpha/beta hydrolase [Rhodococcus sp. (in: high G+C Gram-positive bacteria)]
MERQTVTVPSGELVVRLDGPDSGHAVLLLPDGDGAAESFDATAARLATSDLRTVVLEPGSNPDDGDVLSLLDALGLPWVNLVGRGSGADRAWSLAARTFGRVSSLVVIGRGHPAVTGDSACPAVELRTTMVVEDAAAQDLASASSRFVYGDYRVVTLDSADPEAAAAALATEIVMRTSAW